jgi:acyl dehydratase
MGCGVVRLGFFWDDYEVGEKIDHVDGMTVEESDHMLATRLYQNTAKVHFNQHTEGQGRFGRRLIYGGHVISLARALAFNGCANAFHIGGDQWRAACGAAVCWRHGLCVERGFGSVRDRWA